MITSLISRQMQLDTDARLSDLCADSTEKKKSHKRTRNIIDSLIKQQEELQEKLKTMTAEKLKLQKRMETLVASSADLEIYGKVEDANLKCLELTHEVNFTFYSNSYNLQNEVIQNIFKQIKVFAKIKK